MKNSVIYMAIGSLVVLGGLVYTVSRSSDDTDQSASTSSEEQEVSSISQTSKIDFIEGALVSSNSITCVVGANESAQCNEITIAGTPADHAIGPFCPSTTSTLAEDSGIWLDGDNIYDADGQFILDLAEIYDDDNWKLYNDDGSVNVTDTAEAFDAAARPNVDPAYQNHCVEGQLDWTESGGAVQETYTIPANPTLTTTITQVSGKVGVTYGGVVIDPSAPVSAILGAYTIAAFDDCGGHVNPVDGYHLHAATGCSEVGEQIEGETRAFAIAMDGFSIHSPYEADAIPTDLDECNGHTHEELGYHYHANQPELNGVLTCYMGEVEESLASAAGGGAPGGDRPAGGPPR